MEYQVKRITSWLAIVLIAVLGAGVLEAQEASEKTDVETNENVLLEIQAKMIEGRGDKAVLEKIKNRRIISTVMIPDAGIEASNQGYISQKRVMFESLSIDDYGDFVQGFHDDTAWSNDPINGPSLLTGPMADQIRRSSRVFPELFFETDYKSATLLAEEKIDDEECTLYLFTTQTDTEEKWWISNESHRLIQISLVVDSPMGKIPMSLKMSDFKQVDGVWYPYQMNIKQGIQKMEMTVEKIEHDVEPQEIEITIPDPVQKLIERKKAKEKEASDKKEGEEVSDPEKG